MKTCVFLTSCCIAACYSGTNETNARGHQPSQTRASNSVVRFLPVQTFGESPWPFEIVTRSAWAEEGDVFVDVQFEPGLYDLMYVRVLSRTDGSELAIGKPTASGEVLIVDECSTLRRGGIPVRQQHCSRVVADRTHIECIPLTLEVMYYQTAEAEEAQMHSSYECDVYIERVSIDGPALPAEHPRPEIIQGILGDSVRWVLTPFQTDHCSVVHVGCGVSRDWSDEEWRVIADCGVGVKVVLSTNVGTFSSGALRVSNVDFDGRRQLFLPEHWGVPVPADVMALVDWRECSLIVASDLSAACSDYAASWWWSGTIHVGRDNLAVNKPRH